MTEPVSATSAFLSIADHLRAACVPSTIPARTLMNSTPSKAFLVIVMNCENRSHARKIAGLLRAFPHREYGTVDEPSVSLSMMVKSDSLNSVRTAITPALGKAKAAIGEMSFVSDNKTSSEPFEFMRFKAPTRLGSKPPQR
jgi:hypothetical protein